MALSIYRDNGPNVMCFCGCICKKLLGYKSAPRVFDRAYIIWYTVGITDEKRLMSISK